MYNLSVWGGGKFCVLFIVCTFYWAFLFFFYIFSSEKFMIYSICLICLLFVCYLWCLVVIFWQTFTWHLQHKINFSYTHTVKERERKRGKETFEGKMLESFFFLGVGVLYKFQLNNFCTLVLALENKKKILQSFAFLTWNVLISMNSVFCYSFYTRNVIKSVNG